ncbi:hypothetical protein [Plantactinospora endophytica]|uniref:Glycoside hydrolase family 65 n=1 Tax=Plantactinospora endophytica TaxID=673535 RepID=A0ABQ4DXM3_9ACTN|nr:hypothetical protein [Plantactinospora endophytica]GIG87185.1 hypothetical protein Pen02_21210 [Plantactinospora endophytica]
MTSDRSGDDGRTPAPHAARSAPHAARGGPGIDRRALVDRHAVEVTGILPESPLSVGNGEFCHTVDVTGLQTFPEHYPVPDAGGTGPVGTLLGTQAQWAWHSVPGGQPFDLAQTRRAYPTPRGPIEYVDMRGNLSGTSEAPESPAESWLRNNPHRLDLGRIGLVWSARSTGSGITPRSPEPAELTDPHQRLDLWTGTISSQFRLGGTPVAVDTVCHPDRDVLAVRVESALLAEGLAIRLAFPYGSEAWSNAADWSRPQAHSSTLRPTPDGALLRRVLDDTAYTVGIGLPDGARILHVGRHEFLVGAGLGAVELVVAFAPGAGSAAGTALPTFAEVAAASARHWPAFWTDGGAVELAESRDDRADELERRVVLSQYLTAVHCAGSLPPQETGLIGNSWRGRFHLEMHWWHGAHFPLWGRPHLLERSLGWYAGILPRARETARRQGCAGARWPKQVGPDGRESPSPIGPFLLWQQPHPIFLAELVRRTTDPDAALRRYADVVLESAAFMADYPVRGEHGYQLGPPLVPAQESYADLRETLTNPTFELAYWSWGLRIAQDWRTRLGLAPEPSWEKVATNLVRPHVRDGVYAAVDVPPYTLRDDHPSMLYALGLVPPTDLVDPEVMRATLHHVLADWDWPSTWGWDYPAIAMTATRLGEPQTAVDALLRPVPKNGYLPNGHNRQTAALPVYLPGNGGLLAAVALMARGADADHGRPTPGFPDDGSWTVRHEGLHPMP